MNFFRKALRDDKLLALLKHQEVQAFEAIFVNYHPSLCASAYRIVRDRDASKDIVQEVFIRLWTNRAQLQIKSNLQGYLHKSVVNGALNYLEKMQQIQKVSLQSAEELADNSLVTPQLEAKDLEAALTLTADSLPPVCRTVFMLSRYDQLSNAQIAEYLHISVKAVEKHLTKALQRLRQVVVEFQQP